MPVIASPLLPCLLPILAVAVICDLRSHRVPAPLIAGAFAMALVLQCAAHGATGAVTSLLGGAYAVALFLPLCLSGLVPAADVKLMGAVGAYIGPAAVAPVSVATLVFGGLLALVVMKHGSALPDDEADTRTEAPSGGRGRGSLAAGRLSASQVPYALAIAAGTLAGIAVG